MNTRDPGILEELEAFRSTVRKFIATEVAPNEKNGDSSAAWIAKLGLKPVRRDFSEPAFQWSSVAVEATSTMRR